MYICMWKSLCPVPLFAAPWTPGQNTGVGSLSLLQGIFLSQGSNWGFLLAGRFFTNWAIREACTNDEKNSKLDLNIQFFLERFYTVSVQVVETSLFVFNVLFCIGVCSRRKYLQNTYPMRDLYSENRKNSQNLTVRKQANLTRSKRTDISPEGIQKVSKYMKRYVTSLVMRERQIKTIVSHQLGFPW